MEQLVARKGHSLEVASSSLAFATIVFEGVTTVPADQCSAEGIKRRRFKVIDCWITNAPGDWPGAIIKLYDWLITSCGIQTHHYHLFQENR